jgi:uncharacterized protein (TIGR02118 family)
MAPRLASMTVEQFQEHWRTSHADAAGSIPGVKRYVQNHAVLADGGMVLPYPGFDACSELDFESVAAMDDGFASETYRSAVMADERAFVDKTRFSFVVTRREVAIDGPPLEGLKLMSFYRAHPVAGPPGLEEALRGEYAAAVRQHSPLRRELLLPVSAAHERERMPAAAEAVEIIWFADVATALGFLHSDASRSLAGKAFGTARLLARPVQVV